MGILFTKNISITPNDSGQKTGVGMTRQSLLSHTQNQIILYTAADGKVMANVLFANDTFWLTQSIMSELFGIKIPAISKHLKNIYKSKKLTPEATVSKMEYI